MCAHVIAPRCLSHGTLVPAQKINMTTALVAARLWGIDDVETKTMTCRVTCRVWMFWKEPANSKVFGASKKKCVCARKKNIFVHA